MFHRTLALALVLLPALFLAACQSNVSPFDTQTGVQTFNEDSGQDTDALLGAVETGDGGYPSKVSVAPGESIAFHIGNGRNIPYSLSVYREGAQRQLMATIPNVTSQTRSCAGKATMGCNWPATVTFTVPANWPSGVYTVDIPRTSGGRYRLLFFVRESHPGTARILFLTSVNTFHAYNDYGGGSLYQTQAPQVDKVSFDRPYGGNGVGNYDRWESYFVQWAEAAGYDIAYATTYDLEFLPHLLEPYEVVIIAGHSEYWTWNMRQRVKAFVAGGGRFMNLSGNTMWWQVRFEDNGRTMIGYKNWREDPDKSREGATDENWNYPIRDTSFLITGLHWPFGGYPGDNGNGYYTVNAGHWIFNGTGLTENQLFGKGPTRQTSIHDKESDGLAFNCAADGSTILGSISGTGTPRNFTILGLTPVLSKIRGMEGVAMMGLYTNTAGGAVFSAGTTGWVLGLDQPIVDRITRNILDRFLAGNFPQEPLAADADVVFRDRFNCIALERDRYSSAMPSEDKPKLNYVEVNKGDANRLTADCGYDGSGLAMRPNDGSAYLNFLEPDLSGIDKLYTGVYLDLHDLMLVENTTIDLFRDYDDAFVDEPAPAAVLQLARRGGQLVARYQPAGQDFSWVPVPADRFFLLETTWNSQTRTITLSIDGQQRAQGALPASANTLNRVDFGTIKVAGNASGTLCLDELVYDDLVDDAPPPPPAPPALRVSLQSNGTIGDLAYADEDVLVYNNGWSIVFDGSAHGLPKDVDALAILGDGSWLLSPDAPLKNLPGIGSATVDDSDIVRYVPATGQYSWYFDGSDVGLTTAAEDIDALAVLPDGDLLISALGAVAVPGVSAADEDVLRFDGATGSNTTSGAWSLYIDGSDLSSELGSVDGLAVNGSNVYLSAADAVTLGGQSMAPGDVFACAGLTPGDTTRCASLSRFWQGTAAGLAAGADVDALELLLP